MSVLPQFAAWAVEALVASALLMALVLLVRTPVRRAFGPRVAYALWLLPVLRLMLPSIPASWRQSIADTPISRVGETITVVILPSAGATGPVAAASAAPSFASVLLVAWAIIAAGFLAYHLAIHLTFCRRVLRGGVTVDRIDRVRVVESAAAAGPMAFGILRPTVAVPSDFAERFDADERTLALAHELGHHARGDLFANWIALAVLALHWFNPLAWRAFRTFRADQELANDARVLAGRSPYERHAYACAIVKAAHGRAVGAACHFHSVDDLKGRLTMLRTQISPRRLAAGAAVVGVFSLAALGVTASGTSAAERIRTEVTGATGIALPVPATPATPTTPIVPAVPGSTGKPVHRVVIVEDGVTTTYEGEDARRYMAAHPAPRPPAAPAAPSSPIAPRPPAAPAPPSDGDEMRFEAIATQVTSANCGAAAEKLVHHAGPGAGRVVICTDRIARVAEVAESRSRSAEHYAILATARAQAAVGDADRNRFVVMRHALEGLRRTRASFAVNAAMPAEARREVTQSLEDSISDLEDEMAQRS